MTPDVEKAIAEIKGDFPDNDVKVTPDDEGGAYVIVQDVVIGDQYKPPKSWVGFLIPSLYPRADIYPHFIDSQVVRTDGKGFQNSVSGPKEWQKLKALQLSRKSRRWDPTIDTSGGFAYGGWTAPYSDAILGTVLRRQMNMPFDLLLGRKTFEIWAPYWPQHADAWPGVNAATKYVASNTMTWHEWRPSVFLSGDIAERITRIKQQPGPALHVWGSGNLLQTLIQHDLVDAFWLKIYPIALGGGKRLFADGTIPMAFKVTESTVTSRGVLVVNYERAGAITTGS